MRAEKSGRMSAMLTIWRRHTAHCKHRAKGRNYLKCNCPIWADGYVKGRRILRQSLKTHDMARARKRAVELENPDVQPSKSLKEAADAFVKNGHYLSPATLTKRTLRMDKLKAYAVAHDLVDLSDVGIDDVEDYLVSRGLASTTVVKELETLRQFFEFCRDRDWIRKNPAKKVKSPKAKPKPVEPYTEREMALILDACEQLGRTSYERLRARAMILTLRYTGLRISDVATLALDRIRGDQVLLYTRKTGAPIYLPVHSELKRALEAVPPPRGGPEQRTYFFWNGLSTVHSAVNVAESTLYRVFELSGVKDAHSHRFRHTLATEILSKGGSEQDVADVLGISPSIVRKHYAKWSQARQERISQIMHAVHGLGTNWAQAENRATIQ